MADDAGTIDEDLFRMKLTQLDGFALISLVGAGQPLESSDREGVLRALKKLALPISLSARLTQLTQRGVPAAQIAEKLRQTESYHAIRLAIRLMLLGARRGGEAEALAEEMIDGLFSADEHQEITASLQTHITRRPLASLEATLDEFLRAPSIITIAERTLAVRRGAPVRQPVHAITPERYRHPLDEQTTRSLSRTLPFEDLARALSQALPERLFRLQNASSHIRVGPDQFGEVYAIYQGCVERMGIHPEPPLYLARGGLNAYTAGVEEPFVVLNDTLVSLLPPAELEFVIGHELGHIKFDHVLYIMLANMLKLPASVIRRIPLVGPLLSAGVELALYKWMRTAELSCDRAGLLCCQDEEAAFRVMMRFAGAPAIYASSFNVDAFIAQHDDLESQWEDLTSRFFYALTTMTRSHPWAAVRARELRSWIDDDSYGSLMREVSPATSSSDGALRADSTDVACPTCMADNPIGLQSCISCGGSLKHGAIRLRCPSCDSTCSSTHRFCESCGAALRTP